VHSAGFERSEAVTAAIKVAPKYTNALIRTARFVFGIHPSDNTDETMMLATIVSSLKDHAISSLPFTLLLAKEGRILFILFF
jgi:hypothetical protein